MSALILPSSNHFASVISSDGEVLVDPSNFTNNNDGFLKLVLTINAFDKDGLIIGLKSTAHCSNNFVKYLVSSHFKACFLNPIQTSNIRKNNIRKTKTDSVDSLMIARTLRVQPQTLWHWYDASKESRAVPVETGQAAYQDKDTVDSLSWPGLPRTPVFPSWDPSQICLCPPQGGPVTRSKHFHAYDSSYASSWSCFP